MSNDKKRQQTLTQMFDTDHKGCKTNKRQQTLTQLFDKVQNMEKDTKVQKGKRKPKETKELKQRQQTLTQMFNKDNSVKYYEQ